MRPPRPVVAALLSIAVASLRFAQVPTQGQPTFEFRPGDRICLLGGALAERMQHDGWLETRLQRRLPRAELSFRNLGFAADELTVQQRTDGFGTWDDWLLLCKAEVVFAFFGAVESFGGAAGLADFRRDLTDFIARTQSQRYDGKNAPRLVLFSPIAYEDTGDSDLPDATEANARLAPYVAALADVAREQGVPFVDLFAPLQARYAAARASGAGPLTIDGMHLGERGNAALAEVIEAALLASAGPASPESLEPLRREVLDKDRLWFNRYRATDGYNVYGGRSSLAYLNGQTNAEVLQRELDVLDALCERGDRRIRAVARGDDPDAAAAGAPPVPELIPVVTNRPGAGPGGAHLFLGGEEALVTMTPAPGMSVGLFADEARFPELANPVQMSWDTRGRLWVAVWPTYPHWQPGQPMDDKLLVFEDADRDGRAERCTAFADDLHNPTGFEFWNGGVLVANAPDLLFLEDTDGDGRADVRTRVLGGLSSSDTHHAANSFVLGPDGALYFQEGIFHHTQIETVHGAVRNHDACVWRYEPRTRRVERYVAYPFLNPHGHVFDRWGQDFVTDGTGNDNYYAAPVSGRVEFPASHGGYFSFFDQRSRPAAATEILSSRHFPDANQGNYLIANVIGFQGIFQYRLRDDGSGFAAEEVEPILHGADPNFRPVDLEVGPDGALYFLDWQAPLIGHMQHHLRDPSRDHSHGRVYRVTCVDRPLSEPLPIAGRSVPELLGLLAHSEDRVRYRVRIELSGRDGDEVVAAARRWAAEVEARGGQEREHDLLEALWVEQQHNTLDQALLERLLGSPEWRARAAAVRVLRHMRRDVERPLELLRERVLDDSPRVRLEALVALSFIPQPQAAELALLALQSPMDQFLDYALAATLTALEPQWRAALVSGQPFASEQPEGLALLLARLDTDELVGVCAGDALDREHLSRPGLETSMVAQAAANLAARRGTSAADELLAAIERADGRDDGHADHLLSGLFGTLARAPGAEAAAIAPRLGTLATRGRRASTRRLATVAGIRARGSLDEAWREAERSPTAMCDLLDALPLLGDAALAAAVYPRVLALLDPPPAKAGDATSAIRGRYVRVELPGPARTLTLAEVQVLSHGENVASAGSASQSSAAWDGVAARAIDGNTSGAYADDGQTHTIEDRSDPWWELDLGSERPIDAIVLWNRSEDGGRWLARLDGWVVSVLDSQRHSVARERGQRPAAASIRIELTAPSTRVRRAAASCLAALGAHPEETAAALVRRFPDEELRPGLVDALLVLPAAGWSDETDAALAAELLALFEGRPREEFESASGRALLGLADELLPRLERDTAAGLCVARRRLGPQVIVIRPVPDSLLYDRREFTVVAGRPVEIVIDNTDIMPHNLVVAARGALALVGLAGERMAASPDAGERGYVPDVPEVLTATRLLRPGESETLRFDAPAELGDYPYVCTFPGHWIRMNGVMHVVSQAEDDAAALTGDVRGEALAPTTTPVARAFVRDWRFADLERAIKGGADELERASAERGRTVFEAASCARCHQVGGEGGLVGPDLAASVARLERAELLRALLEPSQQIAEGYASEVFVTDTGAVHAGRVLAEDERSVQVLDNPYSDQPLLLERAHISERRVSELSAMPDGLLSTFSRDEILDLLAYLLSLPADR